MIIEIQNTRCKFLHEIELLPADVLEDIGCRLREHLVPKLATDISFLNHLKSCAEFHKREAARKLNARKHEVEKALKLVVEGEEIFTFPENENETICVFLKLEAMRSLPLQIRILEYTPRDGIDAIGHFRLTESSTETRYACIEFEYVLENFFEHGHPVEQTDLIICWDYDPDAYPLGEITAREVHPWWLEIAFRTKTIPALILSRTPAISGTMIN